MSFCVRIDGALVPENLRLVWMDAETHFFSYILEFTQHFSVSVLWMLRTASRRRQISGS